MKFVLLAAAALLAGPALAQTSGSVGPVGPGAKAPADQSMPMQTPPPAADPAPMPMAAPDGTMTPGGYQPATAPTAGPFQQAVSPSEAFPPPAPLASYPVCKKGQYDKCIQRGGR